MEQFADVDRFSAVEVAQKLNQPRTTVNRALRTMMAHKMAAFVNWETVNSRKVYFYTIKHRSQPYVVAPARTPQAPTPSKPSICMDAMERFWHSKRKGEHVTA